MLSKSRPRIDSMLHQFHYLCELPIEESPQVITPEDIATLEAQVATIKDPSFSIDMPANQLPLGVPASYWLSIREYDQVAAAAILDLPVILLCPGRDYQVTDVDVGLWKGSLGEKENVVIKFYKKLNHLFIEGEGHSFPAEYFREGGHVDANAMRDVIGWIKECIGK